ncbi:sugar nucleotide-binding protein [Neiella sp. HB171785]|uniref:dTDP-4-dehydrorhamnose reductase n=1 Tax=Neiella litorisoli TaxID=2771431 RepID=A0A8J6QQG7_9GAMM|nr:sugar nucleotide-binding protein [Neiella litorisoli]MBD1389361.1 sugar nucleotide-binding protein [Neiella litorisoli]
MNSTPKRVLVTGLNGTLAPILAEAFGAVGISVIGWDRLRYPTDDWTVLEDFWSDYQPQACCHLGMGSPHWAGQLAAMCQRDGLPMLFTSTAMVFDASVNGPYHTSSPANPQDDYGRMKLASEHAVVAAYPDAIIARLGWQIHHRRGGNTMYEALSQQMEKNGKITASNAWIPATSMMSDTADALVALLLQGQRGLFHLDSNAVDQLDFADIVKRLNDKLNAGWTIEVDQSYRHDQRLLDSRAVMPKLSSRLNSG